MQGFESFGIEDIQNNMQNNDNSSWRDCYDMEISGIVAAVLLVICWILILYFQGLGGFYCLVIYLAMLITCFKILRYFEIPKNVLMHHFIFAKAMCVFVYLFHYFFSLLCTWLICGIASPFEIKGDFTEKLTILNYCLFGIFAICSGLVIEGTKYRFMKWSIANRRLCQIPLILGGAVTFGMSLAAGLVMIAILTQAFQNNSFPIVFSLMLFSFAPLQACTSYAIGIGLAEKYMQRVEQNWYSILQLPVSITILSQFQKIFLHTTFRDFLEVRKVLLSTCIIDFILIGVAVTECYFQFTKMKRRGDAQDPSNRLMN